MEFKPEKRIKTYGLPARDYFTSTAKILRESLEENVDNYGRSVTLQEAPQPTHTPHYIRVSLNPEWYKDMYRNKKHCSRKRTLESLTRIENVEDQPTHKWPFSTYDGFLRQQIFDINAYGVQDNVLGNLPPNNTFRSYFNLPRVGHGYEEPEASKKVHRESSKISNRVVHAPF